MSVTEIYTKREPRTSVLYKTIAGHIDAYFTEIEAQGQRIPKYVRNEFEGFLKCGILAHGFVRIGCSDCKSERMVAFSCKKRGFCSSCGARRQAELVDYLSEKVFVDVPVRQYVLSLPFEVRYWFACSGKLMGECYRIFAHEVERQLCKKSTAVKARSGTVAVLQRFSSDLSLNPHIHLLAPDGVFISKTTGREKFEAVSAISDEQVQLLTERVSAKIIRLLVRRKYIVEEEVSAEAQQEKIFEDAPWVTENIKASTVYRIAHGPRAGQQVRKLGIVRDSESKNADHSDRGPRCSEARGFSLHCNSVAKDKAALQKLASYIARPAISTERLTLQDSGDLIYRLKKMWRNGVEAVALSPYEFLERLVALIPPFYSHTTRYSGVYGPAARNRNQVTLERIVGPNKKTSNPHARGKNARIAWAQLLKKVFRFDLTVCLRCGGPTRLIGTVFSKSGISKILDHLGLESGPPSRGGGNNGWGAPLQEWHHQHSPTHTLGQEQFSEFGL